MNFHTVHRIIIIHTEDLKVLLTINHDISTSKLCTETNLGPSLSDISCAPRPSHPSFYCKEMIGSSPRLQDNLKAGWEGLGITLSETAQVGSVKFWNPPDAVFRRRIAHQVTKGYIYILSYVY